MIATEGKTPDQIAREQDKWSEPENLGILRRVVKLQESRKNLEKRLEKIHALQKAERPQAAPRTIQSDLLYR
jgi:hypothetical protein